MEIRRKLRIIGTGSNELRIKRIESIRTYLTPELRQKIYLTLAFASLIFLFLGIWQVKPVVVDVHAPLGLASYLTPLYWVGLAIIVLDSILVFLDKEVRRDAVFLTILIVVGLFVFGTEVFIYANPLDPSVYHPTSEVQLLLTEHHIDIGATPASFLPNYHTWPSIHFISASILEISGIEIWAMLKYFPLFWMLFFVLATYAICKRFSLTPNQCFLVSFLAISSWLVPLAGGYKANSLAMILYLSLLLLLIVPRRTPAEVIAATVLFCALVFTHGFATLPVLAALIALAIYRRETRLITLFIVIFFSWYVYRASIAMAWGTRSFWTIPFKEIFLITQAERYQLPSVTARAVNRYSELGYLATYCLLIAGSFILLLRQKITGQHRKQVITAFFWLIGVASVIVLNYGGEGSYRLYLFCLVPAACIIAMSFSSKKLIIAVICLLIALSPLANHAVDAAYRQVRTTELKGSEFFALNIKPWHSYYYGGDPALVNHYQPAYYQGVAFFAPSWMPARTPDQVDLSFMDTHCQYVIISSDGTDHVVFGWGVDPYASWPEKSEVGKRADLLYNNGYFQVYWNSFESLWNPPAPR